MAYYTSPILDEIEADEAKRRARWQNLRLFVYSCVKSKRMGRSTSLRLAQKFDLSTDRIRQLVKEGEIIAREFQGTESPNRNRMGMP